MDAERLKHLAVTVAIDPQNAAARGMMGPVAHAGRWLPPEKVSEVINADEAMTAKLGQYEAKRVASPLTAEAQWQLGLWCERNGLKAEATAHFSAVTRLAPRRTEAWHKLGCQLHHGRWLNAEQLAAERAEKKDETLVSTPVHRFWRPGRGWAMARDLKPGDLARTAGGRAEVVEIRPDAVQPVFNLDVARNHSFFVGSGKALVRDNSLPPAMFTPFDAEPSLASIAEEPSGPSGPRRGENHATTAAQGPPEPASPGGSEGASSAPRKSSMLGPRTVEPTSHSPR